MHEVGIQAARAQRTEQVRLNALWWAQALFSQSAMLSYRDLDPSLAVLVMAVDLADEVGGVPPASVGYLLVEAVRRLVGARAETLLPVHEALNSARTARTQLPPSWQNRLRKPPPNGRFSLRDAMVLAISNDDWNAESTIARTSIPSDLSSTLPQLAHAIFRQEAAVRLAEPAK